MSLRLAALTPDVAPGQAEGRGVLGGVREAPARPRVGRACTVLPVRRGPGLPGHGAPRRWPQGAPDVPAHPWRRAVRIYRARPQIGRPAPGRPLRSALV